MRLVIYHCWNHSKWRSSIFDAFKSQHRMIESHSTLLLSSPMEEVEGTEVNWFDDFYCSQLELLRELQAQESPRFMESQPDAPHESVIDKLISALYSNPAIGDVESAVSVTFQNGDSHGRCNSQPMYAHMHLFFFFILMLSCHVRIFS